MAVRFMKLTLLLLLCLTLSCSEAPQEEDLFHQMTSFFSFPGSESEREPEGRLIDLIQKATESIDIALEHLEHSEVADALIEARDRGVFVRVVTDADHMGESGFERLVAAEILITVGDGDLTYLPDPNLGTVTRVGSTNLMSHSFAVIDRRFVWIATGGILTDPAYRTGFVLRSENVAKDFTSEFNQLFGGVFTTTLDTYGSPIKSITDPRIHYPFDDLDVEIYFGPQDRLMKLVMDKIYGAKISVRFVTDYFSNPYLLDALEYKHQNGFYVQGVVEGDSIDPSIGEFVNPDESPMQRIIEGDLDIRKDALESKLMQTVVLIDVQKNGERARDGHRYPQKILVLSHGLKHTLSFEVDTAPDPDEINAFLTDTFIDGNLVILNNDGLSDQTLFDTFQSHFKEIYDQSNSL